MPLCSVEREGDFLPSLSQDLAPHTSSPMDVTEDALVSTDPPAPFHHSREFEEGEDLESASELNMSVTPNIEHRDFDESDNTILQEIIMEIIEPTSLKFGNDILSIEYESFSCGFDINEGLNEGFCVEYNPSLLILSLLLSL